MVQTAVLILSKPVSDVTKPACSHSLFFSAQDGKQNMFLSAECECSPIGFNKLI